MGYALATVVLTLFERPWDMGMFLMVVFAAYLVFRYSVKIWRGRLAGEGCSVLAIKLFSVSAFIGFCALARFALVFYEWDRAFEVFGVLEPYSYFGWGSGLGVWWVFAAVLTSLVGFGSCYLSMSAGEICSWWVSRFLVRFRYAIVGCCAILLTAFYGYAGVWKPIDNRRSLLEKVDSPLGIDAYLNSKEVRLYSVEHERRFSWPPPPPGFGDEASATEEEEAEWRRVSSRYRGYKIDSKVRILEEGEVRRWLDEIYVYKSVRSNGYANSQYLMRFVGESTVLDLWFSSFKEIEIFSNEALSDLPYILGFTKPYDEVMARPVGEGLKFSAPEGHGIESLF